LQKILRTKSFIFYESFAIVSKIRLNGVADLDIYFLLDIPAKRNLLLMESII